MLKLSDIGCQNPYLAIFNNEFLTAYGKGSYHHGNRAIFIN